MYNIMLYIDDIEVLGVISTFISALKYGVWTLFIMGSYLFSFIKLCTSMWGLTIGRTDGTIVREFHFWTPPIVCLLRIWLPELCISEWDNKIRQTQIWLMAFRKILFHKECFCYWSVQSFGTAPWYRIHIFKKAVHAQCRKLEKIRIFRVRFGLCLRYYNFVTNDIFWVLVVFGG